MKFLYFEDMELTIQHEDGTSKGRFLIPGENGPLAEMTYVHSGPNQFIIDHTEVSDELRGMGAGAKLVEAAVVWARQTGKKILPLCPFAKATMERKRDQYADVLA